MYGRHIIVPRVKQRCLSSVQGFMTCYTCSQYILRNVLVLPPAVSVRPWTHSFDCIEGPQELRSTTKSEYRLEPAIT